jgi:putative SbcD/Mre11-related phosphoesterase
MEEARVLAVADLHLGYAWAHRHNGQLLPLSAQEDSVERLQALVDDYAPQDLVLLGDIVHSAVEVKPLREEICRLFSELSGRTALRLVAGNHDTRLAQLLTRCGLSAPLLTEWAAGADRLVHGDQTLTGSTAGRVIMGHEHPAISLGDRVTRAKCPCFLVSSQLIVLPAFSTWAAGTDVRSGRFLSPLAGDVEFSQAVAIIAGKLLPVSLN